MPSSAQPARQPHPDIQSEAQSIRPVQTLRTLATDLEAALTLVRSSPDLHSVHRLRTSTRRVEAQLTLLAVLPDLPDHGAASAKLNRLLRRLRRAAGAVRDLDVQRDLLHRYIASSEKKSHDAHRDALAASAKDLRKLLKHRRIAAADDLLHLLKRKGPKLAIRLEELLHGLRDSSPTLSPDAFKNLIEQWYRDRLAAELAPSPKPTAHPEASQPPEATQHPEATQPPPTQPAPGAAHLSADQLHTVRKLAKLARYLGESAAPDPQQPKAASPHPLADVARRFESLQDTGGVWHDALTLAKLARRELGKRDPLSHALAVTRDRALDEYQKNLTSFGL